MICIIFFYKRSIVSIHNEYIYIYLPLNDLLQYIFFEIFIYIKFCAKIHNIYIYIYSLSSRLGKISSHNACRHQRSHITIPNLFVRRASF